jgi:hypothetical protein
MEEAPPCWAPTPAQQRMAEELAKPMPVVNEDTIKKIRGGFYAALISGTLTLVFTLIAMSGNDVTGFLDGWAMIDVVLIFALAIGIFFKSRFAATTMFLYFLASKFYIWHITGKMHGVFMAVVFIYFYFQAMIGTFEYHKQKNGS